MDKYGRHFYETTLPSPPQNSQKKFTFETSGKGVSFSGSILITTKISLDQPFQHLLHFNYVLEQPAPVSRELYFIYS